MLYYYDLAGHLIAETDENGTQIREYLYLGEQAIVMRVSGNCLYYVHNDHLGTPRILTDPQQNKVWEVQTTPFGEISEEITDGITQLKGFLGQYRDPETGYSDNWNRTYDPSIGRYVQSDPIGLNGGLNTYGYVLQNPTRYTDPTGLEVTMVCRRVHDWKTDIVGGMKHCAVFVWHWEIDPCTGENKKVIDKQYSLAANGVPFHQGSNSFTYTADTSAFNNPGGENEHYQINPPSGVPQEQFDDAIISSGNHYQSSEDYSALLGPNSNTAADNIIEYGGGTAPDVDGAWQQNYGEY